MSLMRRVLGYVGRAACAVVDNDRRVRREFLGSSIDADDYSRAFFVNQ